VDINGAVEEEILAADVRCKCLHDSKLNGFDDDSYDSVSAKIRSILHDDLELVRAMMYIVT